MKKLESNAGRWHASCFYKGCVISQLSREYEPRVREFRCVLYVFESLGGENAKELQREMCWQVWHITSPRGVSELVCISELKNERY